MWRDCVSQRAQHVGLANDLQHGHKSTQVLCSGVAKLQGRVPKKMRALFVLHTADEGQGAERVHGIVRRCMDFEDTPFLGHECLDYCSSRTSSSDCGSVLVLRNAACKAVHRAALPACISRRSGTASVSSPMARCNPHPIFTCIPIIPLTQHIPGFSSFVARIPRPVSGKS